MVGVGGGGRSELITVCSLSGQNLSFTQLKEFFRSPSHLLLMFLLFCRIQNLYCLCVLI